MLACAQTGKKIKDIYRGSGRKSISVNTMGLSFGIYFVRFKGININKKVVLIR